MNLDYIAGFFDGEGCLSYSCQSRQWIVQLAQSEVEVLERMKEFLELCGIHSVIQKKPLQKKCTKPPYALIIARKREVTKFLGLIHFRLVVKRQHAEDAYRFLKLYPHMTSMQRRASRRDGRCSYLRA